MGSCSTKDVEGNTHGRKQNKKFMYLSEENSQLLVTGYIRCHFTIQVIPNNIVALCIKWYLDIIGVSLQELYNLVQQRICLFDLRSSKEYQLHHINESENISEPMTFKTFEFKDHAEDKIVVLYGNKNNITNDICYHLYKIAKSQKKDTQFYVFNGEYNDFYAKYRFLCTDKINQDDNELDQYPNMILLDKLYLGSGFMSENKNIILNLKINHIMNVSNSSFMIDQNIKKNIKYLQLHIDDSSLESISKYFDKAYEFINKALNEQDNNEDNNKNVVFVHCMVGVSRSASIIISYLMKSQKWSLYKSYLYVKSCRPQISPNNGFFNELVEYEKELFGDIISTKKELQQLSWYYMC